MNHTTLGIMLAAMALGASACASTGPSLRPTVDRAAAVPSASFANVAACEGLPEQARQTSLFAQREQVAGVERMTGERRIGGRITTTESRGARVLVRATPGVTEQYLERIAQCQVAAYATSGHSAADEPLSVPGASAEVRRAPGAFAIEITAPDAETAREILARAERLKT